MGIVQRQSFKNIFVNYVGVVVGAVSTFFIYPLYWEFYGNLQFSLSTASLVMTFTSVGCSSLVNKYFPYFKLNNIKGLLSLISLFTVVCIVITSFIFLYYKPNIYNFLEGYNFNVLQLDSLMWVIFPIAIATSFISILRYQSNNFKRIVYPDIITNFSLKLFLPILILLLYYSYISEYYAYWAVILFYFLTLFLLLAYLGKIGGLDFSIKNFNKIPVAKYREMLSYLLFNSLNQVGHVLVYRVDLIMIGLLFGPVEVGYYSVFLFMSVVLEIPTKAVFQITSPIVSSLLEQKEYAKIDDLYKRSSLNLVLIGMFLFGLIWLNIDFLLSVMTNGAALVPFKNIFFLLGITRLLDMLTSLNYYIISYSKYFRYNTLFLILLAVMNIIFNYIFIEDFGLVGVAWATTLSMFIFNFLKTGLVFIKYKMHPFKSSMVYVLVWLVIIIILNYFTFTQIPLISLSVIKSLMFAPLFLYLTYRLKISEEFNSNIDNLLKKLKIR
jgi:O-antigen/teichoic acid export membrane protein